MWVICRNLSLNRRFINASSKLEKLTRGQSYTVCLTGSCFDGSLSHEVMQGIFHLWDPMQAQTWFKFGSTLAL